jgi:putative FmdB family regulatory protein
MPIYDYACAACGPFEGWADAPAAGAGATCASCGALAARTFSAPGGRRPRRQRQLEGLGGAAVRRVDRAEAGDPAAGGMPDGARIDRSGRPHTRAAPDRRPWQLGH